MNKRVMMILSLLTTPVLVAQQETWKGDDYAKNSAPQKASDAYLNILSPDELSQVGFIIDRLEVEAIKVVK